MLRLASLYILVIATGCLSPGGDIISPQMSEGEPGTSGPAQPTTGMTAWTGTMAAETSYDSSTVGTSEATCGQEGCPGATGSTDGTGTTGSASTSMTIGPQTTTSDATEGMGGTTEVAGTTGTTGTSEPPDTCGDTIVQPDEECDDGNNIQDDGCSNSCHFPRFVFVTQSAWTGDLGGVKGADTKCNSEASKSVLLDGKTFRAWISTGLSSPATTFDHGFNGVYRLVDGTVIALNGWKTLSSGVLTSVIDGDHNGALVVDVTPWTATSDDGSFQGEHCSDWTSSLAREDGSVGSLTNGAGWSLFGTKSCQTERRLYCFENP